MKKKTRILTACIAVIFIFCTLVPVAYAVDYDPAEGPLITFEPPYIPEPGSTPVSHPGR